MMARTAQCPHKARPKAPSEGSQFYIGGTVESELGQLLAFFQSDRVIPGDPDQGRYKRCKVKGIESVVGRRVPSIAEANEAMADPSQQEAMRIKIHNWLCIAFSRLVERQVTIHSARKKILIDLLGWRLCRDNLHGDMAVAMNEPARSETLIQLFSLAVRRVCMDMFNDAILPQIGEAEPVADLRAITDFAAVTAAEKAAAAKAGHKGKGKGNEERQEPWHRAQRQRTEGPPDRKGKGDREQGKGKGRDERPAGKGKDGPPRDQRPDPKGQGARGAKVTARSRASGAIRADAPTPATSKTIVRVAIAPTHHVDSVRVQMSGIKVGGRWPGYWDPRRGLQWRGAVYPNGHYRIGRSSD